MNVNAKSPGGLVKGKLLIPQQVWVGAEVLHF